MKIFIKTPLIFLFLVVSLNTSAQEITIMSYNIKFANEIDGENGWSKRKNFLVNQIKFYEPDILGVQEALPEQMKFLDKQFEAYKYEGVGRDGGENGEYSGIFYNANKFEVLEADTFWLSKTPSKPSKNWDAALNRICTYARFRVKESGEEFWVFNTHLDHRGKKARRESTRLILEKITDINNEKLPLTLMGDFNLEPETSSIQLILRELNDAREVADLSFGSPATFNGFDLLKAPARRIDYIFVNDKIKVRKFATLTDSKEQRYPSDHFPVYAQVKFKN